MKDYYVFKLFGMMLIFFTLATCIANVAITHPEMFTNWKIKFHK